MEQFFPLLYFGPTEYYRILAQSENPIWVTQERYTKQTLRNRCSIYGANGKIQLSLPVVRPNGKLTSVSESLISYAENWQQIHWRSIKSAYGRTPYFEYFEDKFEALYQDETQNLQAFLEKTNQVVLSILKIEKPTIHTDKVDTALQKHLDAMCESSFYETERPYYQIFEDRHGFIPNLSVLDWIFHCGPKL